MASPSDPEKDSNKSQSKADNPFIKFRQFADQQISSLLPSPESHQKTLDGQSSMKTSEDVMSYKRDSRI
jgi:hypothetical protein